MFTDIEGSTRLLFEVGEQAYQEALAEHRRTVRAAFRGRGGYEVDYEGDSFFYSFRSAREAVAAVAEALAGLEGGPIRLRVGIHTGEPGLDPPKYIGLDVHRAARIMSAAHGGQVLLSARTASLVEEALTELGEHRLKDFDAPVALFQLGSERFPPLKTISNTNLPRPSSSFVGRERERDELVSMLMNGARLLTISGPGGSGKTRLAIEAASELVPAVKAGVFWIDLSALRDPALVSEEIAQTLGAKEDLAEHIGEREMLLLLDNFEQVVEAAPELSELVERCPRLRLLVTSRELLRVRGEVDYPVPSLAETEAVELFCDRAQVEPDETIIQLCHRLDELPLALELAAARTRVISPRQILERLSQRLDLLKGGRDADPRQQTLRATIDWSHDLLDDEERRLFARLAVFAGECTLAAAEEVCGARLDTLHSLVAKNLLRHANERYWMLETIREYANDRFDELAVRSRHAEYFLMLAEEAAPHLVVGAGDPTPWVDRLAAEHDNLRAAYDFFDANGKVELQQRLAAALWRFWQIRGYYAEGLRRLQSTLGADARVSDLRAEVARGAGFVATFSGDNATAERMYTEALGMFESLGDRLGIAQVHQGYGALAIREGDYERGRALLADSAATFTELGYENYAIWSTRLLAWVHYELGEIASAREIHEQVVSRARAIGSRQLEAESLGALGGYAAIEGHLTEATALLRASTEIFLDLGDPEIATNLCRFARALAVADEPGAAAQLLACGEAAYEELGRTLDLWLVRFNHQTTALILERLDEGVFRLATETGKTLTPERALEVALRLLPSTPPQGTERRESTAQPPCHPPSSSALA